MTQIDAERKTYRTQKHQILNTPINKTSATRKALISRSTALSYALKLYTSRGYVDTVQGVTGLWICRNLLVHSINGTQRPICTCMYIDFYIYQHHVSAVHIDNNLSSRYPKNPLGVHPIPALSGIPELERGCVRENTGRTLWLSEGLGTEPILAIINPR